MKIFTTYGFLDESLVELRESLVYEDEYLKAYRIDKYLPSINLWVGNDLRVDVIKGKEFNGFQTLLG